VSGKLIKRVAHIVLSAWLAVLLIFGTTAKEYIHLFAHHEDTVHTHHEGLSFENEHHHCTFLSFTLSPFISEIPILHIAYQNLEFKDQVCFVHERIAFKPVSVRSLRGPPVFIS
jgi:hypothetical protein